MLARQLPGVSNPVQSNVPTRCTQILDVRKLSGGAISSFAALPPQHIHVRQLDLQRGHLTNSFLCFHEHLGAVFFVQRSGSQLTIDGKPFYFIGRQCLLAALHCRT